MIQYGISLNVGDSPENDWCLYMEDNKLEELITYDAPAYVERKRRWGDRKEGRRVRTLPPMNYVSPFIMKVRSDSQNHFDDMIDITNAEAFLARKHKEGMSGMTLLHIILAAYVRTVAERPGINRFISGQRIFARKNIECTMTVKKEMSLESPDTCIKIIFDPRDNVDNVYKKFRKVATEAKESSGTDFDKTAKKLMMLPRLILRGTVSLLRLLDYVGLLPKALLDVSPFHGSMIITSMGSLGIPAIYHHLYDFGNLPIFISYGNIFTADAIKRDGTRERHRFITFRVVTDERICDGYYYASAFKKIKRYILHPEMLENTLDRVEEDID